MVVIGLVLLILEHYMFRDFSFRFESEKQMCGFLRKAVNNISSKCLDLKDYFNTYSDSLKDQSDSSFLSNFCFQCNLHFWEGTYKRSSKTVFQCLFGLHSQQPEVMGSRLKRLKVLRNRLLVRPVPQQRHCKHTTTASQNNQRISNNIQRNTLCSTN